jgi:hypothetical protein
VSRPDFYYCLAGRPHNYEPNTVRWPVGSLVLHDVDAKYNRMLMRVVRAADAEDCIVTTYADQRDRRNRGRMRFPLSQLHDPARFGVDAGKGGAAS